MNHRQFESYIEGVKARVRGNHDPEPPFGLPIDLQDAYVEGYNLVDDTMAEGVDVDISVPIIKKEPRTNAG